MKLECIFQRKTLPEYLWLQVKDMYEYILESIIFWLESNPGKTLNFVPWFVLFNMALNLVAM